MITQRYREIMTDYNLWMNRNLCEVCTTFFGEERKKD